MVEDRSANPNRRKPRASKPKVRTGCLTCKSRRVKCDETKPSCMRCQKFGRTCEGYPGGQRNEAAIRQLLPRTITTLTTYSPPPGAPFANADEFRYFTAFREEAAVDLAGAFDSNLWARVIPQASQTEPFVRHAAIAIGALGKVMRASDIGLMDKAITLADDADAHRHHQFALQQYGKALRCLTDDPGEDEATTRRKCLLACIMVFCFESFHGDHDMAMLHLQSGLGIMHDWLSNTPYPPTAKPGISSPAPNVVDDELVHAFSRLDLQVMTFVDLRPVAFHLQLKGEGTETVLNMPTSFHNLHGARLYWELIMRRVCHLLHIVVNQKVGRKFSTYPATELPGPDDEQEFDPRDEQLYAEHDAHIAAIARWCDAFQPLHDEIKTSGRPKDILGATILEVHSMIAKIMAASVLFTSETQYDTFLPEFRQIVELCRKGLQLSVAVHSIKPIFSFDLGLISPLHLVSVKCRDRQLRREAISLLIAHPHREGVWDSIVAAQLAYWMMEFEEEGVDTLNIPEHARAKVTNVVVDLKRGRRARLECSRQKDADDRSIIMKDKVLTW